MGWIHDDEDDPDGFHGGFHRRGAGRPGNVAGLDADLAFRALAPCDPADNRPVLEDGRRRLVSELVRIAPALGLPPPRYAADGSGVVRRQGRPVCPFTEDRR